MHETIGFIGLGNMGRPMVTNLIQAGHTVTIYDSNPEQYAPLVALGARPARTAAEVAEPGGIVLVMVPDDQAVLQVISRDLLTRLGPRGIVIPCSTIRAQTGAALSVFSAQFGVTYLAASVLGRPDRAAEGTLMLFVSGQQEAKERVLPLLNGVLGTVVDLGEPVEQANQMKLAFNAYMVGEMFVLAHLLPFVTKAGGDPQVFLTSLQQFVARGTVVPVYGPMIAQQRFDEAGQGFRLTLGEKDVHYYLEQAEQFGVPVEMYEHIHFLMRQAQNQGFEAQSWAVFTQFLE
jgi:3-hydroxyisobutyrate dehydrogenase-like beta-hydroxyacid dehydrogenase